MPARPWNLPSLSVYSLATLDLETGKTNMNICTYVSAVSMEPKLILVAVYKNTKTLENLQKNPKGILQLLTVEQANLVKKFGKTSGRNTDKLKNLKNPIKDLNGIQFLTDCVAIMELDFQEVLEVTGDHIIYIGKVISSKNLNPNSEILTTSFLKDKKIIR
jgi:flavin reductase (DIM6/NTAB) family NADH-FMN oxidoreductase RutF